MESTKIKNDKDLNFNTEKMNKLTVLFSSVIFAMLFYFGFVNRFWDKENRSKQIDYYTRRPLNILKLKLGHQDLLNKLKTNQSVQKSYLSLNSDISLYKLESSVLTQQ